MQEELISTVLRAAIEETGAQRGLLILWRGGEARVAGEATRCDKTVVARLSDEVVTPSRLPESILNYVQHI